MFTGRMKWVALAALVTLAPAPAFAWERTDRIDRIERSGDVIQVLVPAAALAGTLVLKDREGTVQLTKGFLLNLGVTYTLKYAVDRQRPRGGGGQSFPSGHTSASFQGATFLQMRYGWKAGVPAYVAASYVGWSRVEARRHYWTDVLGGAAIGALSSYVFTTRYQNVTVAPLAEDGVAGVRLTVAW